MCIFTFIYVIPVLLITYCYTAIIITVRNSRNRIAAHNSAMESYLTKVWLQFFPDQFKLVHLGPPKSCSNLFTWIPPKSCSNLFTWVPPQTSSNLFTCSPYIDWLVGGWPLTERPSCFQYIELNIGLLN